MKKLIALLAIAAAPVLFAQEKAAANAAELHKASETTTLQTKAPAAKATTARKAEVKQSQQEIEAKQREAKQAEAKKAKTIQASQATLQNKAATKK